MTGSGGHMTGSGGGHTTDGRIVQLMVECGGYMPYFLICTHTGSFLSRKSLCTRPVYNYLKL